MTCYIPDCNTTATHNGLCTPHSAAIECRKNSPITREFVGQIRRLIESVDNDWQKQAKCRDVEINSPEDDIFHTETTLAARSYCSDCPVRAECAAQAIKDEEQHGVWGGLSVRERDGLRKLFRLPVRTRPTALPTSSYTYGSRTPEARAAHARAERDRLRRNARRRAERAVA